jgi:predicted RNase H-like HicB family nuclease
MKAKKSQIRRLDMKGYHINIFYSEEDEGYIADTPDLKHCSAFGETPEEALREGLIAREAWLEAAHAGGKPLPLPRYKPVIYQAAS